MSKDTIPAIALLYIVIYVIRVIVFGLHILAERMDENFSEVVWFVMFIVFVIILTDWLASKRQY